MRKTLICIMSILSGVGLGLLLDIPVIGGVILWSLVGYLVRKEAIFSFWLILSAAFSLGSIALLLTKGLEIYVIPVLAIAGVAMFYNAKKDGEKDTSLLDDWEDDDDETDRCNNNNRCDSEPKDVSSLRSVFEKGEQTKNPTQEDFSIEDPPETEGFDPPEFDEVEPPPEK